ncbi:MAG: 1-phosphofructokinase family hexose kinase [Acidobacteria bacterium]|nr:1-phosphofructokinase family hexose kinase [Acidobacteriota bacterium]
MQSKTILTLTLNPAVDIHTEAAHVRPERKNRCAEPLMEAGGGGINVARAVHKLGGRATAMFAAGGRNGEALGELIDREGIESLAIRVAGETRENFHVFDQAGEQQYRFILPGARFESAEAESLLERIGMFEPVPDYIVASGSLPPGIPADFYGRLAEAGSAIGARTIVDTSGDALRHALGRGAWFLKPNLGEFRSLVGDEGLEGPSIEAAARELVDGGQVGNLLISLGRAGAILVTPDGQQRITAPTVRIVSTVGAGDSTVAGLVLGLAREMTIDDAARFGVAAGAAAVMTPGTELCRREDVERLFEAMTES